MHGLEIVFAVALLAGSALPLGLAMRLTRHRDPLTLAPLLLSRSRRIAPFFVLLMGTALWLGAYALEILIPDYSASVWLHRLVYVGISAIPPAALLMVFEVTERRPSRRWEWLVWTLLAPIPIISAALALTNDHQGYLWAPGELLSFGALTPIDTLRGPWFTVELAFSYVCLGAAFGLLAHYYVRQARRIFDAGAVLVAFALPWLANALHVFLEVGNAIDVTPAAFLCTGLILHRIVDRDLVSDIVPVARARVLEMLGDAVLVMDSDSRLLDANRAALDLLTEMRPEFESIASLPPLSVWWPELTEQVARGEVQPGEVRVAQGATGTGRTFDLRVSRLHAPGDHRALNAIALRDVSARHDAETELHRRAHFDGLTALANRDYFFERLARALRAAREAKYPLAVLLLDLDRFKLVNDANGHAAGDALLRGVADCVTGELRAGDSVGRVVGSSSEAQMGRLGGDEFAIVLPRIASVEDAGDVATRLLETLEATLANPNGAVTTYAGASIGIAVYPNDGEDEEALLKHADAALYQAKEWGGNRFVYSDTRLARLAERRAAIDRGLRGAIAGDQLTLVYQPKVHLQREGMAGVEALIRWADPELGSVSPDEFIPIAERTGLIVPFGAWTIDRACAQVRAWRNAGLDAPRVAVNVSSLQLARPDFVATVTDALRRHDVTPSDLELEITERTLLSEDENTFVALRDLRAIGLAIALDDFGTGYSALGCLTRIEVDTLKIDRSLLVGIDENARAAGLVASVVNLAHTLDMKVVAEGVEREVFAEILRNLGCDEAQGFLYSRPVPPDELAEFLHPA